MRKAKYEITDRGRIEALLASCPVGRLGTVGADGAPTVKPLNFAYDDGKIYFHGAREGEKIEDIRRDPRVCFEIDVALGYVPARQQGCQATYRYESVIVRGTARIIERHEERLAALDALMRKYQPEGDYGAYVDEKLALTRVVCIDIKEMTGKSNDVDGLIR